MFAGFQPLVARRPHMPLNALVESTVYCFEPFWYILDAVSLAVSRNVSRLQNPLAPSMLLLKKDALR